MRSADSRARSPTTTASGFLPIFMRISTRKSDTSIASGESWPASTSTSARRRLPSISTLARSFPTERFLKSAIAAATGEVGGPSAAEPEAESASDSRGIASAIQASATISRSRLPGESRKTDPEARVLWTELRRDRRALILILSLFTAIIRPKPLCSTLKSVRGPRQVQSEAGFLESPYAVRQASLGQLLSQRLRGRTSHLYFWGAFVAAGDWR